MKSKILLCAEFLPADAKHEIEKELKSYLDKGWKLSGGVTFFMDRNVCYSTATIIKE